MSERGVPLDAVVRGIAVTVVNTRPDIDTALVLRRLDDALALIERHQPWRLAHLRRDLARILVQRFACRGAYFPDSRTCLTELTFLANPRHGTPEHSASIIHEGMHARVHRMTGAMTADGSAARAKEERLCRRAELEFGLAVPEGDVVIARALASLGLDDAEVAPVVDWREAAWKVRNADDAVG